MSEQEAPNGWLLCSYYTGVFCLTCSWYFTWSCCGSSWGIRAYCQKKRHQESGLWMGRMWHYCRNAGSRYAGYRLVSQCVSYISAYRSPDMHQRKKRINIFCDRECLI